MAKRDPLLVLEGGRFAIRRRSPFLLSGVFALTPVAVPETETSFVTPGMIMGYNPDFISELTDEEAGFVQLHEVLHPKLRYFEMLKVIGTQYQDTFNKAHDLVINQMLRDMGWPILSFALLPELYGFPPNLSSQEYFDLLLAQSKSGRGGKNGDEASKRKICGGNCQAPTQRIQDDLDKELGRSAAETSAVQRQIDQDVAKHVAGRGDSPAWMKEWANALNKTSTINWRQLLARITLDAGGRIAAGGDDFSLRRPSKRSYVRRIIRPGMIEQEVVPIFILDTSGSMREEMMFAGIQESCGILRQMGISEAYYMEVDAAVALEPKLVSLSFFEKQRWEFHGRGGTDFRPAFDAIAKMPTKPDLAFYWTDGDGTSPDLPPPNLEVIWGLVPGRYSTRKPAKWGHLVVIDDDPSKQRLFEESNTYDEDD